MKRLTATAALIGLALTAIALPAQAVTTKLSSIVKAQLIYLIQEEKLARDVYAALAAKSMTPKFSNITQSEQTHMDALAVILSTYGISNPTTGKKAGVFADKGIAALYKSLVAKGSKSEIDAIAVGVTIEELDIKDIDKLSKSISQADIKFALANLRKGSLNHLAAFKR